MVFIYFNIIQIKIFYIDNIIEKVICSVFCVYIFNFMNHFQFLLLILICFQFCVVKLYEGQGKEGQGQGQSVLEFVDIALPSSDSSCHSFLLDVTSFSLLSKYIFLAKLAISLLLAKFVSFSLAVKRSTVNLLNSGVVIYLP